MTGRHRSEPDERTSRPRRCAPPGSDRTHRKPRTRSARRAGRDPNAYDGDSRRTSSSYAEQNAHPETIAALRARMNNQSTSRPRSPDG